MVTRTVQLLLIASLITGTCRAADSPFIGDWKLNPARSKMTDVMKVGSAGGNKYTFDFGGGPESIVVDGTDQPGGFGTTLSVAVEGPHAWKVVRKKDGHQMLTANWSLSADGNSLTDDFTGINANGSTYNVKYVYKRSGEGSGFAATWVSTTETIESDFVLQVRPWEGDGLSFVNTAAEQTQNVKFDGQDYPNVGPNVPKGSTSSIRRVNESKLEMIYKIDGKVRYTQEVELSSDFKSLTMTLHVAGRSEPNVRVFERQ